MFALSRHSDLQLVAVRVRHAGERHARRVLPALDDLAAGSLDPANHVVAVGRVVYVQTDVLRTAAGRRWVAKYPKRHIGARNADEDNVVGAVDLLQVEGVTVEADGLLQVADR